MPTRLLTDRRGAVFVEKLIVWLPLLAAFFAAWELAELGAASLVVSRASAAAGRAATVVLGDDPRFYGDEEVGSYAGKRQEDIELAAGMVLSAIPRLGATFSVDVDDVGAAGDPFTVRVDAPYDCGRVSLVCGADGAIELSATTTHVYQGARYTYSTPAPAVGGSSAALADAEPEGNQRALLRAKRKTGTCSADCDECHRFADDFDAASMRLRRWECVGTLNPGGERYFTVTPNMQAARGQMQTAKTSAQRACTACGGRRYWNNLFNDSKRGRDKEFGSCKPKCDNKINVLGRQSDILPFRNNARTPGAGKRVEVFDDFQASLDDFGRANPGGPDRNWGLDINGTWIRNGIDNGNIYFVATDADRANMDSARFGCSVTARELQGLINAGYRPYGNWWMKPDQARKCFPGLKAGPVPETYCGADKNDPFHLGASAGSTRGP